MAEGGVNHNIVEQLLTPVLAMQISAAASVQSRVNREASPTGQTPTANTKVARNQYSSRKRLSVSPEVVEASSGGAPWTDDETKALLEFLLFHRGPGTTWCRKICSRDFWIAAAKFVQTRTSTELPRTGAVTELCIGLGYSHNKCFQAGSNSACCGVLYIQMHMYMFLLVAVMYTMFLQHSHADQKL